MNTRCPLPVEWLEHLEGEHIRADLDDHRTWCHSCRALIRLVDTHVGSADLRSRFSERTPELPLVMPRPGFSDGSARVGEIWLTKPDFDFGGVRYSDLPVVPCLVISIADPIADGVEFIDVVPLSWLVDDPAPSDFLLSEDDVVPPRPWRAVFSLQSVVGVAQLDRRVGMLTGSGGDSLKQALSEGPQALSAAPPLEGAFDPRLSRDRNLVEAVTEMRRFAAFLVSGDESGDVPPVGRLDPLPAEQATAAVVKDFALAAESGAKLEKPEVQLEGPGFSMRVSVSDDLAGGKLSFKVEEATGKTPSLSICVVARSFAFEGESQVLRPFPGTVFVVLRSAATAADVAAGNVDVSVRVHDEFD